MQTNFQPDHCPYVSLCPLFSKSGRSSCTATCFQLGPCPFVSLLCRFQNASSHIVAHVREYTFLFGPCPYVLLSVLVSKVFRPRRWRALFWIFTLSLLIQASHNPLADSDDPRSLDPHTPWLWHVCRSLFPRLFRCM